MKIHINKKYFAKLLESDLSSLFTSQETINSEDIQKNISNIAKEHNRISYLQGNIDNNTNNINNNTNNIDNNTNNINKNTDIINKNTDNINTNTDIINKNINNINKNTDNINTNTDNIDNNTNRINQNRIDHVKELLKIQALKNEQQDPNLTYAALGLGLTGAGLGTAAYFKKPIRKSLNENTYLKNTGLGIAGAGLIGTGVAGYNLGKDLLQSTNHRATELKLLNKVQTAQNGEGFNKENTKELINLGKKYVKNDNFPLFKIQDGKVFHPDANNLDISSVREADAIQQALNGKLVLLADQLGTN